MCQPKIMEISAEVIRHGRVISYDRDRHEGLIRDEEDREFAFSMSTGRKTKRSAHVAFIDQPETTRPILNDRIIFVAESDTPISPDPYPHVEYWGYDPDLQLSE